jgi:predicted AlkP superfamily pyrophosphatase or phosphodiesterase
MRGHTTPARQAKINPRLSRWLRRFWFFGLPSWARTVILISIDGTRPDYVTKAQKHGLTLPNLVLFMSEGTYADGVVVAAPTVTYPKT